MASPTAEDYIGYEKNITFLDRELIVRYTPKRAAAMSALGHKQTLAVSDQCPLYPRKQTLMERAGMSALCH